MRIAYVLNSLGRGGAERLALALAHRMAARGHSILVLVLGAKLADEWPTHLPVVYLGASKSPMGMVRGFFRGRKFLRGFRPDLLHSHSFHSNLCARLLAGVIPHVRALSTLHNVYEGGRLRMFGYRITDPLASLTVAVSQAAADRFVHLKAVAPHKCRVVVNGIDLREFSPDPAQREKTRRVMKAGSSFIWLAVGRVIPAKDFPNLLRAFQQVHRAYPDAELWIAGAPMDTIMERVRNSAPAASANRLAAEREAAQNVRWLGMRHDMPALYDAADAFILSSAWEGMPLAVAEAMAMRKPVVATDAGGTRELVGDAGMIVPPHSSGALSSAMIGLMRLTDEERASLGCRARKRVESLFNIDLRADEWERLYRSITGMTS